MSVQHHEPETAGTRASGSEAPAPAPARSSDSFAPAAYQPWWLRLLPFLGRIPEGVSRDQVKLIGYRSHPALKGEVAV